ncbi:MAG TPA: nitroreductase/quinone reductase family protein [Candidatus Limnocylindrales bacterium]|nr:nitroreductase/quinone reductase family protein [Candidatus Limnocylindrales bacterium]
MAAVNRRVIEQFRAGGPVEGMHRERLLLLSTTGARSGATHTAPMMFVPDGERIIVIASNAGATRIPDWYHNLVAHPDVHVELADEAFDARAVPLEGEERDRMWASITERFPFFLEHETRAGRAIPLVALTRT